MVALSALSLAPICFAAGADATSTQRVREARLVTVPALAVEAASPASAATPAGEPNVRRTVVEDGRARIEEVRIRGRLQKVTVAPKGVAPGYEILTGDGSRDLADGTDSSRGATGKRVWNVLRF